jgi:hypothetical protein
MMSLAKKKLIAPTRIPAAMQIEKNKGVNTMCEGMPNKQTEKGNMTPIRNPKPIIHMARSPNTRRVTRTMSFAL